MSEFASGVFTAIAIIAVSFLSFGAGNEAMKDRVAAECSNYGAVKIGDKLYECKLK